jgi:hypothetical protein
MWPLTQPCTALQVVHRSNALLYGSYGEGFRYQEGVFVPGPFTALLGTLGMTCLVALLALRIFHPLLRLITYRPGQGPQYETHLGCMGGDVGEGVPGQRNMAGRVSFSAQLHPDAAAFLSPCLLPARVPACR